MHPKDKMQGWTLLEISELLYKFVYVAEETSGGGEWVTMGQVKKLEIHIDDMYPSIYVAIPHRDWIRVDLTPDCIIKILDID